MGDSRDARAVLHTHTPLHHSHTSHTLVEHKFTSEADAAHMRMHTACTDSTDGTVHTNVTISNKPETQTVG